MKKLVLSSIAILIFSFSFAHNSILTLRLFDNSNFVLLVDNVKYINQGGKINVYDLMPGNHELRVFKNVQTNHGFTRTVLFSGYVNIPSSRKISAIIDRYFQFKIVNQVCLQNDYYSENVFDNGPNYYSQNNYQISEYIMGAYEFSNLKMLVSNTSFDDSKLKIAKQAISMNKLNSSQILELMNSMTFEASKLDLAKFAYQKVVDPQNYYMVNQAFTFNSSIDDLNNFISGK